MVKTRDNNESNKEVLCDKNQVNAEILPNYTPKEWFKSALLGILLGLAIIIPGVSGATIAIIFGLYEFLLLALGNIFKSFKSSFRFLLPVLLGAIIGFGLGFLLIQKLFLVIPFILICLFAGLMTGAMPAVIENTKERSWRSREILLFLTGLVIPIVLSIVAVFVSSGDMGVMVFSSIKLILYFIYGVVISLTQIVPGLSATAFLMMVGEFGAMLNSLHVNYLLNNPLVVLMFFVLAMGFLCGIILFSKLVKSLISRHKFIAFVFISGLSIGSVVSMFLSREMVGVYSSWKDALPIWQIIIGAMLFVVGILLALILINKDKKKNV